MNTLYWHDYETWGTRPFQDKPSQFAGLRTNEQLEIIGEPLVAYCKPSDDVLPHPQACLITGITPQKALAEGLPEPEFMANIHYELAQPGTCGVGYNSLRFDDEVTRAGLYRNFYSPYDREWQNSNSRWDIIDMVRLVYALKPDALKWPVNEQGVVSFRLEKLTEVNGIGHTSAHDALSDVYATISLARKIKSVEPKLYDYAYSLRDKHKIAGLIDVANRKPFLHVSSKFPAAKGCSAIMMPLAYHPSYKNRVICVDLSQDPAPLMALSAAEISRRLFVKNEELPEGCERIALKEIHFNRAPIIGTTKLLDDTNAERLSIDKVLCAQHWQQLLDAPGLANKIRDVYIEQTFEPNGDVEQQLYNGFINASNSAICQQIRQAKPEQLAELGKGLSDKRLQTLLFRYRARHYPHTLSPEEQQSWQKWYYHRLTDKRFGASIVLDEYFEELDRLKDQVPEQWLNDMINYGDDKLSGDH